MAETAVAPEVVAPEAPTQQKPARDKRVLWRLGRWGAVAAISLAAAAFVTQTEGGRARLHLAIAHASKLGHPIETARFPLPQPQADDTAEIRRLTAAVEGLTSDRDRLAARLASLEQNLDDMTGSIKTVTDATAAAQAATEAMKAKIAAPSAPPPALPPAMNFPPIISMIAAPPVAAPGPGESPKPSIAVGAADPPPTATVGEKPKSAGEAATQPKLSDVPLPPTTVASASDEPVVQPARQFGIEIASASDIAALRQRWAAIKSNYGPLLVGLHPIASPHHRRSGHSSYRLVVGPLPNIASAAGLCSHIMTAGASCQPAKFTGEPLR